MNMMGIGRPATPKLLLKIETADARQAHIEDETTGTISVFFSPELFRRFKSNRVQTGRLKKSLDRCAYTNIVVNYVHCWDICRCHLRPLGNLSTTLPEGAANVPRYQPELLCSHSPCTEFCSDGQSRKRTLPPPARKLASYSTRPHDCGHRCQSGLVPPSE